MTLSHLVYVFLTKKNTVLHIDSVIFLLNRKYIGPEKKKNSAEVKTVERVLKH